MSAINVILRYFLRRRRRRRHHHHPHHNWRNIDFSFFCKLKKIKTTTQQQQQQQQQLLIYFLGSEFSFKHTAQNSSVLKRLQKSYFSSSWTYLRVQFRSDYDQTRILQFLSTEVY